MTLQRRDLLALGLLSPVAGLAQTSDYPKRGPVRIVVPFAPGGSVDIIARYMAQQMAGPLGQSVIVENRAGGGGAVGTEFVAKAAPDGYTLLLGSTGPMSVGPNLQKVGFELKDFTALTNVASIPHVLVVRANLPVSNLREFIAYAKANPTKVNYGSGGLGTTHHLTGVMLNQLAGIRMVDIPYKGTGPALVDLVAGQVDVMSVDMPPALPFIHSGRIKVLAIATDTRSPLEPTIPTSTEAGLPGYLVTAWYGIVGPAGMPADVSARLAKVMGDVIAQPATREKFAQLGAAPEGLSLAAFGDYIRKDNAKWGSVIKAGNLKIE
ncbi:Bug family tripartite tricarboxylate transporter substrate binding protein [Ramlibacter sp.]|uniref:Bug family tripartite tricarboxylate transporter substrate binding protein n=1 Tax=Ramlibacter sp. TaxID=1917967 RepID=UPI003D12BCB5